MVWKPLARCPYEPSLRAILFIVLAIQLVKNVTFALAPFSAILAQNYQRTSAPKLVLLDRDGVINEDIGYPGVTYVGQLELTPNAGKAIGDLRRALNCRVAVITNQSCVGRRLISKDYLDNQIMKTLAQMLAEQDSDAKWDEVFVATTTADEIDPRRKPEPGMIIEACEKFNIHPQDTVFVGDTLSDLLAAKRAGVPQRILVSTGYGAEIMKQSGIMFDSGDVLPWNDEKSAVLISQSMYEMPMAAEIQSDAIQEFHTSFQSAMPFIFVENLAEATRYILKIYKVDG